MSNKTVRNAGVAIIVGVLAFGAFWYLNQEDDFEIVAPSETPIPEVKPDRPQNTKEVKKPVAEASGEIIPEPEPMVTTTAPDPEIEHRKNQDTLIEKFKNNVKLEVKLPENMIFTSLDIEDGMEVMYGKDPNNQNQMAIIAAKRSATPQTIAKFLNDSQEAFPMLKGQGFKISGEVQELKAPKSTGLGNIKLIPGQQKSGRATWAAHIERSDGAGSYLFLMQAQPGHFDNNEEGLEAMLKSMKANP